MKKIFSIIGIIVGVSFIIVGILAMTGELGGNTLFASNLSHLYDSGYDTFNADYYTYSVNNTAATASAARTTANIIADIAEFFKMFMGTSSILIGVIVICSFGVVLSTCKTKNALEDLVDKNENNTQSQIF